MFIVKKRGEVARFGLFLVMVALLAYFVASRAELFRSTTAPAEVKTAPVQTDPKGKEALLDLLPEPDGANFYAQYRINRDQFRSARREELMALVDNPNIDGDTRKAASEEVRLIQRLSAQEDQLEAMIKARGYGDVLVMLTDAHAQVYVKADALTDLKARQVAESVVRVTGIKLSGVSVLSRDK